MLKVKSERYCEDLEEFVDVIVRCTIVTSFAGNGIIPTGVECSANPGGRCAKCNVCLVLKKAYNDARTSAT